MKTEELTADKKSIDKMDDLKSKKKHAYRELEEAEDKMLRIDDVENELIEAVNVCEDDLMEVEMLLQDALFTAYGDYKDKITVINSILKEKTNEYIKFALE